MAIAYGRSARPLWHLAPDAIFLNHGSFGACPREVFAEQERLRLEMEAQPDRFFRDRIMPAAGDTALRQAIAALARFVGVPGEELALAENATLAVQAVVRSMAFTPGDEILITDHTYNAVRLIVEARCAETGARATVVRLPLPADQGMGVGKPLKMINKPLRSDIPISIASIGPRNVELTAEIANAWQPIFLYPDKITSVWGAALAAGFARRDPALGPMEIYTSVPTYVGDDWADVIDAERPHIALYVGGMGARGKNYYNELACRYGFEAEAKVIQDLYLAGRKDEAAAAVPDELVRQTSLIGPESWVAGVVMSG